jgi:hypothetical protein
LITQLISQGLSLIRSRMKKFLPGSSCRM